MKQLDIQSQIQAAMRAGNQTALAAFRAVATEITKAETRKGRKVKGPLTTDEVAKILRSQIAQRNESATAYYAASREDLARKELDEIDILNEFLPEPLTDGEMEHIVQTAIEQTGALTKKDMKKVLERAKELAEGRGDPKAFSSLAASKLEG